MRSPWNVAIGQREVEEAEDHQVHADKVSVATQGREKLVLGKDDDQVSDNRDNE